MNAHAPTPMLDRVPLPADCRAMSVEELKQLADDLRRETIDSVSVTGGHLGAGLGVVELTVALHHVFNTPHDKLIWDVGHQAYPHKILTGRRDRIRTIRQGGGLSGFCKRDESEYDVFGAGHSSTSISAGLGMAVARDLRRTESGGVESRESSGGGAAGSVVPSPLRGGLGRGVSDRFRTTPRPPTEIPFSTGSHNKEVEQRDFDSPARGELPEQASSPSPDSRLSTPDSFDVICVIGDGAMSAGMAYEAMNNAGALGTRLIVILNDNDMSIAPPTGAMSAYLSRLISSKSYRSLRHIGKMVASKFPEPLQRVAKSTEHHLRTYATGGTLFEALGFYYVGPVDGHNLDQLLPVLKNVRDEKNSGPVLIHVVTKKGHGYAPAEASDDKYHGVVKFDVKTGAQAKSATKPSYTSVFAKALMAEAEADEKILAITAAMPSGTGIDAFMEKFPDRAFDVGIAEQHAVTFAAGLATQGYKPFCAIYSTFLQRAYDQVVHDVAIQNLPVRFAIDRAGLVGADGATHAGAFDLAYLCTLPNFVVMAAADGVELMDMVATCAAYDAGPIAVRYPRGNAANAEALPGRGTPLEIGRGRVLRNGTDVALLSLGTRLGECLKAAEHLATQGINATVADARFAKPLDEKLIAQLIKNHPLLITIEEGAAGGFGAHVLSYAANAGLLDNGRCAIRALTLPDDFQAHDTPEKMLDEAGLNATQIAETVRAALKPTVSAASNAA